MTTFVLVFLFFLMIAAPCAMAVRSSRRGDDSEAEAEELAEALAVEAAPVVRRAATVVGRPHTLEERAAEAEAHAKVALNRARHAHLAALAAEARAAALRAEAAAEIAEAAMHAAERAIRAEDPQFASDYLTVDDPSWDFMRSRTRGRAA